MPRRLPSGIMRAGQVAISALLLVFLWHVAGGAEAARSLALADTAWLAAAFAALTLQTVLSALRWKLTAAQLGIHLETWGAIREYYLAQAVNLSLPGGVIGDAGRAVRARGQAGLLASGQAVVFERLAGQAGLFLVTAVTFAVTLGVPGGVDWPGWLIAPVALFILGGLSLPVCLYALTKLRGPAGRTMASFWRAMSRSLAARPVVLRQILLSLATTICNLAAFGFCAQAVGHGLSRVAVLAFVPLILLTMLIPLTISGWGLREGAAALLFPVAGSTASGGLAASVAFAVMLILGALPGLLLLLGRGKRAPMGAR